MKKFTIAIVSLLAVASLAFGQAATSTPAPDPAQNAAPQFSISSGPASIQLGGQSVAATDVVGSFAVTKSVTLETDNIVAPALNFQGYYGGAKWYPSFLTKALAKTNASSVAPYFHGAFGIDRNVPATGTATQHYSALVGGGFDYYVGSSLAVGPRFEYLNAPGFGKSSRGVFTTVNLSLVFGK
jgi:hypothetical protein